MIFAAGNSAILNSFFRYGLEKRRNTKQMEKAQNNLLKESFKIFYEKHALGFRNFIRKSCGGDEGLADDIFQESFFRMIRSAPEGLNEYQLRSYLYKTGVRLIIDDKREKRSAKLFIPETGYEESRDEQKTLSIDMEKIFSLLTVRERSLLWLAYVEGYSHREISEMIDVREKSLKVILFRIRKKFVSILRDNDIVGGNQNGRNKM
ncbi:MAG: RNA polymerase sigma factor [Acidobacteriota bacterium]